MAFDFAALEVPTVVRDMVGALVASKSAFVSSGAAVVESDDGAGMGGHFYRRRFSDIDATVAEKIDGVTPLTPQVIGAHCDTGPVLRRARFRRAVDGAGAAEGGLLAANPTDRIIASTAAYWSLEYDTALLNVLAAAFDATGPLYATHLFPHAATSGAKTLLSFATTIEAGSLLGDRANDLVALICHSAVAKDLALEMGARAMAVPIGGSPLYATGLYVGNARVIISDLCPVDTSVPTFAAYTSFLVAPGALWLTSQQGLREIVAPNPSMASYDITQTSHVACGVSGIKVSSACPINPTNAELADPTHWELTTSPATPASIKAVGLVAITTNGS